MIDVLNDVEKLTNIKNIILDKITSCLEYVIIDNVIEEKFNETNVIQLDIGIGIITLTIVDDAINYFFKPSNTLEKGLISAINNNENVLETKLINNINSHIYKTYKDMF